MIGFSPLMMPRLARIHGRRLGKKQAPFVLSPATFRAFVGGRGSGKTYGGAYAGCGEAGRLRGSTGIIVAPTYTMLSDDVVPVLREVAGKALLKFSDSDMEGTFLNGSRVLMRSAADSMHINRLRGGSFSWFWLEEAAHVPDGYDAWRILIATLREGGRMGRGFLTTTPRGKGWIFDLFGQSADADYALFGSRTDENEFTTERYKQILTTAYGVGWFARQELAGEFCDPEGTLFQREWFKIVDRAPEFARTWRGWDLAISTKSAADWTVGVRLGITPEQDVYVLDVQRWKAEWPDSRKRVMAIAQTDGEQTSLGIESVAFQLAAIQELHREPTMSRFSMQAVKTERDKLSYALPVASKAQAGKLYVVRAPWNAAYIDECCAFSGDGKGNDDQVDGTTIAYRCASKPEFRIWT
jgi:predicted phage terminase large subunit-like protein